VVWAREAIHLKDMQHQFKLPMNVADNLYIERKMV